MSTHGNPYALAYAGFLPRTAQHQLTVLHDHGLYRHLRLHAPGTRMWSWDVITWPGYLATSGDNADGFMFTGLEDMIDLFGLPASDRDYYSDGAPNIDFRCWAEKLCGGRGTQARTFSGEEFIRRVENALDHHDELGLDAEEEYDNIVEATRRVCARNGVEFEGYLAWLRQLGDSRHVLLDIDEDDELQVLYYGLEIPDSSPAQRRADVVAAARLHSHSEREARDWLRDDADARTIVGQDASCQWLLHDYDTPFLAACYAIALAVRLYREHQTARTPRRGTTDPAKGAA